MNHALITAIARICHEVNRAYCEGIGDYSQLPWERASQAQRTSAVNGVLYAQANPRATPEDMHKSWSDEKRAAGWSYGVAKDESVKTHPCLVPYVELPQEQRIKDNLFQAVVKAMT